MAGTRWHLGGLRAAAAGLVLRRDTCAPPAHPAPGSEGRSDAGGRFRELRAVRPERFSSRVRSACVWRRWTGRPAREPCGDCPGLAGSCRCCCWRSTPRPAEVSRVLGASITPRAHKDNGQMCPRGAWAEFSSEIL